MEHTYLRGDIFYADLGEGIGSEQSGYRPVVIIQNNIGNKYSPTVIALAITTKSKNRIPTHIPIKAGSCGLEKDSIILVEQVRTLDKVRLKEKIVKHIRAKNILKKQKEKLVKQVRAENILKRQK